MPIIDTDNHAISTCIRDVTTSHNTTMIPGSAIPQNWSVTDASTRRASKEGGATSISTSMLHEEN
jgi:hypothetical protein